MADMGCCEIRHVRNKEIREQEVRMQVQLVNEFGICERRTI